jgi:hypothetical protein
MPIIPGVVVSVTIPPVTVDLSPMELMTLKTSETPINPSSTFGSKTIDITPTLVNAGSIDLVGRKCVILQNNSLNAIYISNLITVSATSGIFCAPGATSTLNIDPLTPTPVYAISIGLPSNVSITEV